MSLNNAPVSTRSLDRGAMAQLPRIDMTTLYAWQGVYERVLGVPYNRCLVDLQLIPIPPKAAKSLLFTFTRKR